MPDSADPRLKDVLVDFTDMPALPNVVAKLTRLIADPKTTASDINEALSSDPGLVTKILKLVNSPYYGFSRRITSITNAVVILGFNQIRNLAFSAFIYDMFAAGHGKGATFDINAFWKHSMGAAFIASRLAAGIDPKLEEDGFICGLLHDLGKFIMVQKAKRDVEEVMAVVRREDVLFFAAEQRCLKYDHALLGAAIMEMWNLPERLVQVVRCHHDPVSAPEGAELLTGIASLADIVARAMLIGNGGDERIPLLRGEVWTRIGLSWVDLEIVMRRAAEDFSKSDMFFSL